MTRDRFRTGGALQGQVASALFGAESEAPSFEPGDRLGPWRIERLLGRGGMSEVYLATRAEASFHQTVALKIVSSRPEFNERLREERRLLAKLKHPGIATLVDGGELDDGRAWFAMEHVEGRRLDEYLAEHPVDWTTRITLFESLCAAVSHAHSHLLVHRDIKPANVMVDTQGRLRLLDFGIAITAEDPQSPGDRWMTPGFAAPEQLRGGDITTATDIYQLGETLRRITSPDAPGAVEWPRLIRQGLDAIIQRATVESPAQRYDTVARLREDLEALRSWQPVRAVPARAGYRLGLFLRRHPRSVFVTGLLLAATAVSAVSLVRSLAREAEERAMALREEHTASAIGNFFVEMFQDPDTSEGGIAGLLDRSERRLLANRHEAPDTRAALLQALAQANVRMERLDNARPLLEEAIRARRVLGQDAIPDLALALATLARIEFVTGRHAEADALIDESRALLDRPGIPDSHARFLALAQLGEWHVVALRFPDADALLEQALQLGRKRYGDESPQLFPVRQQQRDSLRNQWQVARAMPMSEALLEDCITRLGAKDATCIAETITLARLHAHAGQLDRAERTLRGLLEDAHAWSGRQKAYRTHAVLYDLSETLWLQGRLEDARQTLEQSLEHLKQAEGGSGPHWDADRGALALILTDMGRAGEALAIHNERPRRDPAKPAVMEDHFWVVRQAHIEVEAGQVDPRTAPALAEAIRETARIYGDTSYFTGRARIIQAKNALATGNRALAQQAIADALRTQPQGLEMHHPQLLAEADLIRAALAETPEEAAALRASAVGRLPVALYPEEHPFRRAVLRKTTH